ncbi:HD-GYP domain-containing protein [Pseudorhodoferax sp. Leaf267]|uniref:HD-GYP domain-containing protein n=1 Tax=Pseudorhodoferax sp. Leaf267 TaxID=1736316 RepID=UPI0006FD01CB|nr:HD-GYP domain-containing protein [Pseudorhodoferax sp. Leaf267]KQP22798.1 phosphohydrolase [Pseudorhodoferax sp. Leaf267]
MDEPSSHMIDVGQLRRGLFVQLDLGWMDHPFPRGSFKISSDDQIRTIRSLGLSRVRYFPAKSDLQQSTSAQPDDGTPAPPRPDPAAGQSAAQQLISEAEALREQRQRLLEVQQANLRHCERRFGEAVQVYERVLADVSLKPVHMRERCMALVQGCVADVLVDGEAAIRLLSEAAGERSATHTVNVMVISLLLGKALGLSATELAELGLAALLHDLGKIQLPERMRADDAGFSESERAVYREHINESVRLGKRMGLPGAALDAIAQHHEMVDGSGFPAALVGDAMSLGGRVLALVNTYDNLCNPPRLAQALTPHEALSLMFASQKQRFDGVVLGAFIRMMGVYPPGSVVQLVNDRYAIVVSVNSTRPLKPRVLVHDPSMPSEQALILDLETAPELGIRRSLKPAQLPRAALHYLAPRQRVRYFYERPLQPAQLAEAMA